ncbi:MAG: 4-hydroxy-tetrahydrodipicolinate synthase [Gemmatimonadales bacterium]|jgi:4-hydroxy-tetrahydrodipicolinate synthase|nr:4-hydroxy-tetrahydrodipicolinate synthase [Gemmatimonadales bacterium]
MTRLQGCGTALVTPFTEPGAIDFPALRALVDWQIAEGIDFLVPCGSTGEAQTLDDTERQRVVAAVVEVAAGRVPVMAGATSNDTSRAVEETRRMCGVGVDYILSATPYYNKPTQEGLYRHFMAVAEATTRPVCLYNVPGRTAVNLQPGVALRLAQHPNVMGIKEASGDLRQVMDILRERPEDFTVLSGDDWLTLPVITAGGDGLISVVSNEVPSAMTALVHLLLSGNVEQARAWHYRLLSLMDANFLESNPAPVKAALHLMGRIQNVLRLPLLPVSASTGAALRTALRSAGVADV